MSIQKSFSSQNRSMYDNCAYKQQLHQSTSPLLYNINPIAHESCQKCHQSYVGFIGSLGGFGPGIGPNRVDMESDLRGQTRLQSKCASHKFDPTSYKTCGACKNCDNGLPCGCAHCQSRDVDHLSDCRPGIIPIESLDTRSFDACNGQKTAYLDRFDYVCSNPQAPERIMGVYPGNRRLGSETRMDFRDFCGSNVNDCKKTKLPNTKPCNYGGQGCRYVNQTRDGVFN